jgi:hypothetical protein
MKEEMVQGCRILVVIAIAATVSGGTLTEDASAQAWVQPKDGYYFKLSASYFYTDEQYNYQGDLEPIAKEDPRFSDEAFRDISFTAYLEYGLTDRYTLVSSLPFKISTTKNTEVPLAPGDTPRTVTLTNGGLADLWFSIRTRLLQTPTAISLQTGIKMPLGYEPIPDNAGPALGTGEVDAEIDLLFGQSFYPSPAYSAGIGYRVRGGDDFDNEVLYNIEGGYTAGRFFFKVRFDGLQNVGAIPDLAGTPIMTPDPGGGGILSVDQPNARNQDIFQFSPVVAYNATPNFAVVAEAYHVLGGNNALAGTTWVFGMVITRR